MNEEQAKALVLLIGAGMKVLSARMVLLSTLAMVFALFCWALYLPGPERIAAATLFAVLVFLPVIRLDRITHERKESSP